MFVLTVKGSATSTTPAVLLAVENAAGRTHVRSVATFNVPHAFSAVAPRLAVSYLRERLPPSAASAAIVSYSALARRRLTDVVLVASADEKSIAVVAVNVRTGAVVDFTSFQVSVQCRPSHT